MLNKLLYLKRCLQCVVLSGMCESPFSFAASSFAMMGPEYENKKSCSPVSV